jgi:hypothetical protein
MLLWYWSSVSAAFRMAFGLDAHGDPVRRGGTDDINFQLVSDAGTDPQTRLPLDQHLLTQAGSYQLLPSAD